MDYSNYDFKSNLQVGEKSTTVARTFVANVFSWMFLALAITAATSWYFAESGMIRYLFSSTGLNILGWIVMLSPFGFVIALSAGFQRFSASTLTMLFVIYAIVMGMSLSFILLAYTHASIALTFVSTAAMFGVMAVAGYTTKTDLTKMGSLLIMGVIGIVIASLINMFMHSAQMDFLISIIGVIIFTGLTAWDAQKIKRIGEQAMEGEVTRKLTILGALTLYLDFINLFLFLLRFMGDRK
ncbi:MAG: Bax inhibitor-1/YccA family protein [Bacteroidota bacterium]|nr:Bax inhibitor-1/YccA family protein [Bacteroidota bacterium]